MGESTSRRGSDSDYSFGEFGKNCGWEEMQKKKRARMEVEVRRRNRVVKETLTHGSALALIGFAMGQN